MINVKSSKDCRAKIQNGLWAFKLMVLAGLVIAAFFIPNKGFTQAFMIIGLIGGFLVKFTLENRFVFIFQFHILVYPRSITSID